MLTLEKLATHRMDVWGHSFPGCRGTQTPVLPRYAIRPGRRGPSWALAACRSSSTCWGGSYWSGAAGRTEQSLEGGTRSQAEDRVPIHSYCRLEVSPQVDNESVGSKFVFLTMQLSHGHVLLWYTQTSVTSVRTGRILKHVSKNYF